MLPTAEAAVFFMLPEALTPEEAASNDGSRDCMFDYNFRCLSDIVCRLHIHHWMELVLVTEGKLHVCVGDVTYLLSAGEAVYIEPYEPHSFASEETNTCQILEVPTALLQPFWEFLQEHSTENRRVVLREPTYAYLLSLLPMRGCQENPRSNQITYAQAVLLPLCQAFLESCRFTEEKRKYDDIYLGTLNIISHTIDHNPTAPLTLSSVARQLGVHPVTVSQRFSEKSKMTFVGYVQFLRIHRAVSLMKAGMPITDAAYGAGFGSIRTFNRVFRTLTGNTPSAFLETLRSASGAQYDWDRFLPAPDFFSSIPYFAPAHKSLSKKL